MNVELSPDIAKLVQLLTELAAAAKRISEQEAALKATLRAAIQPGDTGLINGQPAVRVTATRRFSETLARQALPPELFAQCLVPKVDAAKAKQVLPPALYQQLSAEVGEPSVRLM